MLKLPEKTKLSTLALSDPLTKETDTKRNHLLFVACSCLLISVYGLKINKTPWLDIEVPSGAPNILTGALSVALVYTLITFLVHAWTDFTRWWIAREAIEISSYESVVKHLQVHVKGMQHLLTDSDRRETYTEEHKKQAEHSQSHASKHLDLLLAELRQLQKRHTALTVTQFLRLAVVDIGVPVVLGGVALAKVGHSIAPFMSAFVR